MIQTFALRRLTHDEAQDYRARSRAASRKAWETAEPLTACQFVKERIAQHNACLNPFFVRS